MYTIKLIICCSFKNIAGYKNISKNVCASVENRNGIKWVYDDDNIVKANTENDSR